VETARVVTCVSSRDIFFFCERFIVDLPRNRWVADDEIITHCRIRKLRHASGGVPQLRWKSLVVKDLRRKNGIGPVHYPRTRGAHTIAMAGVRFGVLPTKIL
jgi:hypothetical protein